MSDDLDADDFMEIAPAKPGAVVADLVVSIVRMGKNGKPKLSLNFKPSVLEEIGGPRFNVEFSASKRLLRVVNVPGFGKFEAAGTVKGARLLLRIPIPPGFVPDEERHAPEFYVNADAGRITIELGDAFSGKGQPAPIKAQPAPAQPAASPQRLTSAELAAEENRRRIREAAASIKAPHFGRTKR